MIKNIAEAINYAAGITPEDNLDMIIKDQEIEGSLIVDSWINVKEKLPENNEFVSISVTGNKANIGYRHDRGHWLIFSFSDVYKESNMHTITHWQPLPAPPTT